MKKQVAWIISLVFMLFAILAFVPTELFYLETLEVDINSGRRRARIHIMSFVVSDDIKDTPFSILRDSLIKSRMKEDFKTDCSFELGSHVSPHYRYHGVDGDLQFIALALTDSDLSDNAQRAFILECIAALQNGKNGKFDLVRQRIDAIYAAKLSTQ